MKSWSCNYSVGYPWEKVSSGLWRKYPNPFAEHVKSCDVIDRWLDENGNLRTIRLIGAADTIPWPFSMASNLAFGETVKGLEYSIVDPQNNVHESYTANLSLNSFMSAIETMKYQKCEDSNSTKVEVKVDVTASSISLIYDAEQAVLKKHSENSNKGKMGLCYTMNNQFIEEEKARYDYKIDKAFSSLHSPRFLSLKLNKELRSHITSSRLLASNLMAQPVSHQSSSSTDDFLPNKFIEPLTNFIRTSLDEFIVTIEKEIDSLSCLLDFQISDPKLTF